MNRMVTVVLLAIFCAAAAFAQYPHVSIHEIQQVPLDSLLAADTLQTSNNRYTLQASPYNNDTVEVTGICMVPKGVFGYNSAGWSILLYDTAAVSQWRGLWLRVNALADTAQAKLDHFDAVEPGDIITVRGVVGEFPTSYLNSLTQLNYVPGQEIIPIGTAELPSPIHLDASTFYNGSYPGGTIRFSTGEPYESMIVEMTNLVVPSYLNTANGTFNMVQDGNMISSYDASDYFTLRRPNPPGWTYVMPPLQGAIDTIKGVVWVVSGGENLRGYRISPVYPGDVVVGSAYPYLTAAKRSPMVVGPMTPVNVSVRALVQPKGFDIDSVKLCYSVNNGSFTGVIMPMVNPADSTYGATIPGQADTSLVRYYFKAYDHAGNVVKLASYSSSSAGDSTKGYFFYRALSRPLTIYDIQYTPYSNGYSPYATDSLSTGALVTVSGIVTADTSDISLNPRSIVGGTYGWYMQSGNAPWSGIWIVGDTTMYALKRGDSVTVTGNVEEWLSFNQRVTTRIANIHAPVIHSSGNPVPAPVVLTTGVFGPSAANGNKNAEPYEGMLVRFLNVAVVDSAPYYADPTQYGIDGGAGQVWVHRDGTNTFTNVAADSVGPQWHVLRVGDRISEVTGLIHFSVNRYKFVPRNNADFGVVTGVEIERTDVIPAAYTLDQNYPNPFNPSTTIRYSITGMNHVVLKIYNLLGQEVRTLVDNVQTPGQYTVRFDGSSLASGVYFCRLQTGSFSAVKKLVLMK